MATSTQTSTQTKHPKVLFWAVAIGALGFLICELGSLLQLPTLSIPFNDTAATVTLAVAGAICFEISEDHKLDGYIAIAALVGGVLAMLGVTFLEAYDMPLRLAQIGLAAGMLILGMIQHKSRYSIFSIRRAGRAVMRAAALSGMYLVVAIVTDER